MANMSVRQRIVLSAILVFMMITNLLQPFATDVLVTMAAAFQADFYGNFPQNVYHSWSLRGIGDKYTNYIVYKIAALFVSPTDYKTFTIAAKIVYHSFFLGISALFFRLLQQKLAQIRWHWIDAYLVFLFAILTLYKINIMQAEETAIFFTLGMVSFTLSENKWLNYFSGIFLFLLLACKAVTIAYAAYPALLILYFYHQMKPQFRRFVISNSAALVLSGIFYFFVIPQEVADITNATKFQDSFGISFNNVIILIGDLITSARIIPVITVGYGTLVLLLLHFLKKRQQPVKKIWVFLLSLFPFVAYFILGVVHIYILFASFVFVGLLFFDYRHWRQLAFLLLLAAIPSAVVLVQARFWGYHYMAFVPFALIVIYLAHYQLKWPAIRYFSYALPFFIWLYITFVPNPAGNLQFQQNYVEEMADVCQKADEEFQLSDEEEILYLGFGHQCFFIHAKSYLRYYYPLPLERAQKNETIRTLDVYAKTLEKTLNYTGDYILIEPYWFGYQLFPELHEKIDAEYTEVFLYKNPDNPRSSLQVLQRHEK